MGKWALFAGGVLCLGLGAAMDFGTGRALMPALYFYVTAGIVFATTLIWAWPMRSGNE